MSVAPEVSALPPSLAAAVFPLTEFYRRAGVPLPEFRLVDAARVPEPWRGLLVHDRDMTPTLEEHHGGEIRIEVLGRERRGEAYFREVILRRQRDDRAVEFGANCIDLTRLPPLVRRLVLQEQLPLGHLLKAHDFPHHGKPRAFFRVEADAVIRRAFGLEGPTTLYGRRNTLRDREGRPFSDVIEILPPS